MICIPHRKLGTEKKNTQVDKDGFAWYSMLMENKYRLSEDVSFAMEALGMTRNQISKEMGVSTSDRFHAFSAVEAPSFILEKFYSFAYSHNLRLNRTKVENYQELLEKGNLLLFHGSRDGLNDIDPKGSRKECDFSNGFYCSEFYSSALCFVEGDADSSIYLFEFSPRGLKIGEYSCDLEWMLSVCYYRGMLRQYSESETLKRILSKHAKDDVLIAPIADNKRFQIRRRFGNGQITTTQAVHALSAARLGKQFVFKTDKAVSALKEKERLYLCKAEKEFSKNNSIERGKEIQTKLDFAKRQYRNEGLYIDEVLI